MGRGRAAGWGSGSPPRQPMAREMLAPPALQAAVLPEGPQGQAGRAGSSIPQGELRAAPGG